MSQSPLGKPRVRRARPICAPVSTSTGRRLLNDVKPSPNPALAHPRLPAHFEPLVGSPLPLLSQLLLLRAHRHQGIRRHARCLARCAPPAALSSLSRGWLRPGARAEQENDQCLIFELRCGAPSPPSCSTAIKSGCTTIRRRGLPAASPNPFQAPAIPSATRCRRQPAARRRRPNPRLARLLP